MCLQEEQLYIALAGQHQIWRFDIASGVSTQFSGDGSERNFNGRCGNFILVTSHDMHPALSISL